MKVRVSATIEENTLKVLNSLLRNDTIRNKSHAIERAIQLLDRELRNLQEGAK